MEHTVNLFFLFEKFSEPFKHGCRKIVLVMLSEILAVKVLPRPAFPPPP